MNSFKFLDSYKCDCFQPHNYCNCIYKPNAKAVLVKKVKDVAVTLAKVMEVCYIPARKAKLAIDVVNFAFLHFEEVRHRIDTIPEKRLFKGDLFYSLHRKCDMTRHESQMAYSIIKRAFRAFYHGTGEGGVPDPVLSSKYCHSAGCYWLYASKRTAQILGEYKGLFMVTQKAIEGKIKQLYTDLYVRLCAANVEDISQECTCENCAKRINRESLRTVTVTIGMHTVAHRYEAHYRNIVNKMMAGKYDQVEEDTTRQHKCSCRALKMHSRDSQFYDDIKTCENSYSQGPYQCSWLPVTKEEYDAIHVVPVVELPEEHPCPPCEELASGSQSVSCGSESICDCEDCTCYPEDELDVDEEDYISDLVEAEKEDDDFPSSSSSLYKLPFNSRYYGCKNPRELFKMYHDSTLHDKHEDTGNTNAKATGDDGGRTDQS